MIKDGSAEGGITSFVVLAQATSFAAGELLGLSRLMPPLPCLIGEGEAMVDAALGGIGLYQSSSVGLRCAETASQLFRAALTSVCSSCRVSLAREAIPRNACNQPVTFALGDAAKSVGSVATPVVANRSR